MSNPFERLKHAISNIRIEYKATDYLASSTNQQEVPTNDGCCCNHEQPEQQQKQQPSKYYTEEQLRKVLKMYEEEKCRVVSVKEQFKREQTIMAEELEHYKSDIKRLASENELLLIKCTDLQKLLEKNGQQSRNSTQRERLAREEQERTNLLLADLNREINEERSKNRTLAQRIPELEAEVLKLSESNKRLEEQYARELASERGRNDEMKKILDFQIALKGKEISELHEDYGRRLIEKDSAYRELQKHMTSLDEKWNNQREVNVMLAASIRDYETTIKSLRTEDEKRIDEREQLRQELTSRIEQLMTEVERLASIEKHNIELQNELEQQRAREKYHIVEVKDHTKQIELEVTKRQLMELIKEKALFEERLKKMCRCKSQPSTGYKQTLVEYDNHPKLQEYLKTHEVLLRKES